MRGEIENKDRARQIISFKELRWGNITPTDIDCFIEYHNKTYVHIEAKLFGVDIQDGQMLAYERQCDDLQKVKQAFFIIARHDTPAEKDVILADCIVEKFRHCGQWLNMMDGKSKTWTVRELLRIIIG